MHRYSSVPRTARIPFTLEPARRLLARASFGVALAVLSGTALATGGAPASISAEQRFQLALEAQTSGDYAQMLTELRAAADGGRVGSWQMHFLNRLRHAPGAARDCS